MIYQSANSSLKGKIGETSLWNITYFPDDIIEVTTQKIILKDTSTAEGIKIYIEVKMYRGKQSLHSDRKQVGR